MTLQKDERGLKQPTGATTTCDNEARVWPSERIPYGGIFHAPKVEYSKETADLVRLLMKESRMTMLMRKQLDNSLRNGAPLPAPRPPRPNTSNDPDSETLEILRRARNAKRKSLKNIIASGAYESSYYRPRTDDRQPGERAKACLQETMSGMKLADPTVKPMKRKSKPAADVTENDLINELLSQINERADWLAEMEELGQGQKYRAEIREQISERLRRIRAIETKLKLTQHEGCTFLD